MAKKRDPKIGTGKKPKGSGRRLYTDENPKDTVGIKFATPTDARKTVAKVKKISKPFARKIQKILKDEYHNIGESMMSGTVDNMEKYKYMLGQAHTCLKILQEISNLLNEKEQKNEKGTVIKLDTKS